MSPLQLLIRMLRMLPIFFILLRIMQGFPHVGSDWCNLDTGYTTITDGRGYPYNVYISVTRDGSVWMRAGVDHESADWTYQSETKYKVKVVVLGASVTAMLKSMDYLDYCVLSDLEMDVNMEGGWHPSYLVLYDPDKKTEFVASFKKRDNNCHTRPFTQSNFSLTRDKQGITCDGGPQNVCGLRHLPEKGQSTSPLFINHLQLDPKGADYWSCEETEKKNFYSMRGSFYHAYVKLATCPLPTDSRMFGHGATLRAHTDEINNTIIIPDPTQTVLQDSVINGWQVFVKEMSIQHGIYLQVWRPTVNHEYGFTLAGQSYYSPVELRFQKWNLEPKDYIYAKAGDVLGIYFPQRNPLAWSSVPCAFETQHYKYHRSPRHVQGGRTLYFTTAPYGKDACRHYSFAATFANKTHAKLLEDWICPTARLSTGARIHSETGNRPGQSGGNEVVDPRNDNDPTTKIDEDRNIMTGGTIPLHLILIIIGCLFVLLMVVGFISYYKAIRS